MQNNETITINGENIERDTAIPLLEILHKPSVNGTTGLHLSADMNNVGELKIIENELNASTLIAGRSASMYSSVIDNTGSTGGFIHSFSVTAIGNGNATIEALGVFSGIVPIHHHSGAPANVTRALLYTGVFTDVTEAFSNTGNDTSMFVSNGDSVYVGHTSIFSEIQFALGTHAGGAGIKPIFEYSTGAGGWTSFNPLDGTDGMRSDGSIAIESSMLAGWATDTISGSNIYWIRINRTQAGLGTIPIEDFVQIVAGTDYIWNEDGDIEIRNANVTGDLIVDGTSDFNGAMDGHSNTFDNIGAACNDLGATNAFCASNFAGIVDGLTNNFNNLGNVGNDLQAVSNTLIATTFSGVITWGANTNGAGFRLDNPSSILGQSGNFELTIASRKTAASAGDGIIFQARNNLDAIRDVLTIESGTAVAAITLVNSHLAVPTNDTLSLFSDAIRIADIYSVVSHQKSLDTGAIYENEITPSRGESFSNGDVVCLYKLWSFTKCSATYTFVLSAVEYIGKRGIIGYENIIKYELVPETEFYAKNVTDADGKIVLTRAIRNVLIPFRDTQKVTLDDGTNKTIPIISYRISMINQSYTEKQAIWGTIHQKLMLVFEKPMQVKICSPVTQGQYLVAGLNGCANGVDNLQPRQRYIGRAAEDSIGGMVGALVGWN